MPREQFPLEIYGIDSILEDGIDVRDLDAKELLMSILIVMRKVEIHLSELSGVEIKDKDVRR